jgi:hypothetical protein
MDAAIHWPEARPNTPINAGGKIPLRLDHDKSAVKSQEASQE